MMKIHLQTARRYSFSLFLFVGIKLDLNFEIYILAQMSPVYTTYVLRLKSSQSIFFGNFK